VEMRPDLVERGGDLCFLPALCGLPRKRLRCQIPYDSQRPRLVSITDRTDDLEFLKNYE